MPYLIFEVASIQIDDQIAEYVFILRRLIISFILIPDYIAVEQWATVRLPPNATNKQTARDRDGLVPEVCCSHT